MKERDLAIIAAWDRNTAALQRIAVALERVVDGKEPLRSIPKQKKVSLKTRQMKLSAFLTEAFEEGRFSKRIGIRAKNFGRNIQSCFEAPFSELDHAEQATWKRFGFPLGVRTVDELAQAIKEGVVGYEAAPITVPNVGKKTFDEIVDLLKSEGLLA